MGSTLDVTGISTFASDVKIGGTVPAPNIELNADGTASFNSQDVNIDSSGRLLLGTTTADGEAPVQIAGATTLGTTEDTGGLSIVNTSSKTYPTTSSFRGYPGYYLELELGTSQTIDPTTPGGYNFVYGDTRYLTKSAGNTSDIERLYLAGLNQLFTWDDANTCQQYTGIVDTFVYKGVDANSRTSGNFIANKVRLLPPDGGTQTIANLISPAIFINPSGSCTLDITNCYGYTSNIRWQNTQSGTKTVNISNYAFYETDVSWGVSGSTGTLNATVTNLYGIRLRTPTDTTGLTITNNWGIYQDWSSAKNWFAGDVKIAIRLVTRTSN